ncbi:MAG: mechanosensitive ion channel [Acidimicrobiales bacterium]|nr:mechanosensitive ion channel [Acidimicrobiales bacterium]MDG2219024.1 mechanosensitive ion channel [Acidimicrobiales bacterium]
MIDPWIFAIGSIVVGLLSGVVGAALVRRIILANRDDQPEAHDAARASAMFLFLFFTTVGVIVAIGFTNPETLEPIPAEILRESPRVLAAGFILIAARAVAFAVGGMVNGSLEGSGARMRGQIASLGRMLVYSVAIVLALSQLGVETTVLSIIVAGFVFAGALAFALLVGLGGRELGGELAAGRYLHRLVHVGDEIEVGSTAGRIVAMHPASVELALKDGSSLHLANSRLTNGEMKVRPS